MSSSSSKDTKKVSTVPSSERNCVCNPKHSSVCDESSQTVFSPKSLSSPKPSVLLSSTQPVVQTKPVPTPTLESPSKQPSSEPCHLSASNNPSTNDFTPKIQSRYVPNWLILSYNHCKKNDKHNQLLSIVLIAI